MVEGRRLLRGRDSLLGYREYTSQPKDTYLLAKVSLHSISCWCSVPIALIGCLYSDLQGAAPHKPPNRLSGSLPGNSIAQDHVDPERWL